MKNKFLGIICFLYSTIIGFVWEYNILGNFLAPQMQMYLKVTCIVLLIMGIIICFDDDYHYKFKISDLILMLPFILLIFAGDGRLTTAFANNRTTTIKQNKKVEEKEESFVDETKEEIVKENYDLSNIDFDIQDDNYYDLGNYITYITNPEKVDGKTIKVRGFTQTQTDYLPKGYFAIGKYGVSCCAADAGFVGFIVKYDDYKIKDNAWYEIEGVLQHTKDLAGYDIMVIRILNIKEIDSNNEEVYVYPCYAYGDGMCTQITKYNLEN